MKAKSINKLSISLNILLILFVIIYFFAPFASNGILLKIFSPICSLSKLYQGDDYIPGWCMYLEETPSQVTGNINENINSNVNTNDNVNTNVNVNSNTNENSNLNTNINSQIANPAAVKCQEDGGNAEAYQTAGGEAALCVFKDKSICEEWAYFRGECKMGKCLKECQQTGTRSEGWYNSCTKELIKYDNCAPDQPTAGISSNLTVTGPQADEQLTSPIQVTGRAKSSDNKVYVRVKSKDGQTLIDVSGSIKNIGADGFGDFSLKINYEFSSTKEGIIEVFTKQNESEENLVSIPVKF
jgi:putative hemolysin